MTARHAAITFLEDSESLKGVDPEFRKLVEFFHRIPFCASFGVSCAGHFDDIEADEIHPKSFRPSPWGSLNIIVLSDAAHILELLEVLCQKISNYPDASFKKIEHVFGPLKGSRLEVWEIRIGDNSCLRKFKMGENWFGEDLPIKGNKREYARAKTRYQEIKSFWQDLAEEVANFCERHGFEGFMLEKRVEELIGIWKQKLETSRVPGADAEK